MSQRLKCFAVFVFKLQIKVNTMTLYKKREKFSSLSVHAGRIFGRLPLTPNQWTILSLAPAILGLIAAFYGSFLLAAVFFGLTAVFDIIDGAVARAKAKASDFGAYLDTIIDRYVEFIIIISIFFLNLPSFFLPIGVWIIILIFGSMLSTYAKSASAEKNLVRNQGGHGIKGGLLEHPDRLILLFLIFLLSASLASRPYASYVLMLMAVLVNISALQRIGGALAAQNHAKKNPSKA